MGEGQSLNIGSVVKVSDTKKRSISSSSTKKTLDNKAVIGKQASKDDKKKAKKGKVNTLFSLGHMSTKDKKNNEYFGGDSTVTLAGEEDDDEEQEE